MIVNYMLDEGAFAPKKAFPTDAGADLRTPINIVIPAHGSAIINTGVHVELPEGYTIFVKSKSGLNFKHNLQAEGVIDVGYMSTIGVKMYNHGDTDYVFNRGDKLTQIVVLPIPEVEFIEVESFMESARGNGGFGSTGR